MKANTLSDTDIKRHLANTHQLLEWLKPAYAPLLEQRLSQLWDETQRRSFLSTLPVKSKPVGRWDIR